MASPQRPYIHDVFGPELLISWPGGQKAHEEAMQLYYAGDYTAALQKLDIAIADPGQFSQAKEKDTAILLTTKAEQVMLLGDTEEANTLLLRAQALADRVLSANHPVTERIQSDRALVLFVRGKPAEAQIALERAVATQAGRSSTNDVAHARSLNHKALMCLAQGDPAQASVLMEESSQIIKKVVGTQSPLYGQNELLKSQIAAARGEYEKAVQLCESSLTTLTNCLGPEHLILVSVRKALADNYQQLGMYEQAAPLLQDNLRTLEKTIGSDNAVLGGVLNSLGLLHYRLGNYADAERLLRRCLSIQEKILGVNTPAYAATVNNLALAMIEQGKDDGAAAMYRDAAIALEKSLGKNSPELATVLLNRGTLTQGLGHLDQAKEWIEQAIAILETAFTTNHPALAEATEAYARLQCARNEFEHALHLVSLARSIKTNFFGADHPAMADTLSTEARIYAAMKDEYRAVEFYGQSALIRARALGAEHPSVGYDLEAAALALCSVGDFEAASQPFIMALRLQRDYVAGQITRTTAQAGLRVADQMYYRTELFHSLCALSSSHSNASVLGEAASQLASCKALLEEVQATQASLESDSRTAIRELRDRLDTTQKQLARLPESNLDPVQKEARRRQLQNAKGETEEALAGWNALVARTIRERSLTLADVARSLPERAVLIDFIQYQRYDFAVETNQWKEERYAAYLTFPLVRDATNVVVERVDLGVAAPINEAVELVCQRMSARQITHKDLSPALKRLSQLVYAPLDPHLTNVSHVIVCPDGQLSRLPFEMLSVGNKFLVEEKTISYVTSGREVVRIAGPKSEVQSLKSGERSSKSLVMGDPDFDLDLNGRRRREEALTKNSLTGDPKSEIEASLLLRNSGCN